MHTTRIIGGMFGMETLRTTLPLPPFLEGTHLLLANARSGIRLIIERLQPAYIWMPAFLCEAMMEGVPDPSQVRFYGITSDLHIANDAWLRLIRRGDVVIFIDYFGFPCDGTVFQAARDRGAWVLEDASQALLSASVGIHADFVLFSPRKMLAVPDGGILLIRSDRWPAVSLVPSPGAWTHKCMEAFVSRLDYDCHGGERRFYKLFRQVEDSVPIGPYAMSTLAQCLLECSFDYNNIAIQRRRNYGVLVDMLGDYALFPELPTGVVPLGFPICVRDRDLIRDILFEHDIFPSVHWPVPCEVPDSFSDSHSLSRHILTLVCDQRYTTEDMKRTGELLLKSCVLLNYNK